MQASHPQTTTCFRAAGYSLGSTTCKYINGAGSQLENSGHSSSSPTPKQTRAAYLRAESQTFYHAEILSLLSQTVLTIIQGRMQLQCHKLKIPSKRTWCFIPNTNEKTNYRMCEMSQCSSRMVQDGRTSGLITENQSSRFLTSFVFRVRFVSTSTKAYDIQPMWHLSVKD